MGAALLFRLFSWPFPPPCPALLDGDSPLEPLAGFAGPPVAKAGLPNSCSLLAVARHFPPWKHGGSCVETNGGAVGQQRNFHIAMGSHDSGLPTRQSDKVPFFAKKLSRRQWQVLPRYGVTRAASPVKAALTWKLVLPQELKVCGVQLFTSNNNDSNKNGLQMINSNIVELDHLDGILLRDWWREELWKTEELLVVAILTDQCHLDNLLWRVTTAIAGNCSKPVKQRQHWSSVLYGFF